MKKLPIQLAAAALILSGCAQNELLDTSSQIPTANDGKIRFAATSALAGTRAATGNPFANTAALQTLGTFTVNGFIEASGAPVYSADQPVTWNGSSWEYANEPYWPSAKVNFFAHANWPADAVEITKDGIVTKGELTIAPDQLNGDGQKDLLLAATPAADKATRTLLTFKHALTQIYFSAKNLDADLDVRIGGIRIAKIGDIAASMTFGTNATLAWALKQENNANKQDAIYYIQGLQADASNKFTSSTLAGQTPFTLAEADGQKRITSDKNKDNALLLIPQQFGAWDPNLAGDPDNEKEAYIELLAIINKTGKRSGVDSEDKAFYYCGTPVKGLANGANDKYATIRIPVSSVTGELGEWTPGKRINYIITFGDRNSGSGGGGYDPDNGKEVLVPIRFKAVVEDWVDVNVPLLTATFEASSDQVNSTFISNYTAMLLRDINAARSPKVYDTKITIKGKMGDDATIDLTNTNKIVAGSTVTYDFSGITEWNSKTITVPTIEGWEPTYYKGSIVDGNKVTSPTEVNNKPVLDNKADIVVFTKKKETDANKTAYQNVGIDYIPAYIDAFYINETADLKTNGMVAYTINLTGVVDGERKLDLSNLETLPVPKNSFFMINVDNIVDKNTGIIKFTIPNSWKVNYPQDGVSGKEFKLDVKTIKNSGIQLIKGDTGQSS